MSRYVLPGDDPSQVPRQVSDIDRRLRALEMLLGQKDVDPPEPSGGGALTLMRRGTYGVVGLDYGDNSEVGWLSQLGRDEDYDRIFVSLTSRITNGNTNAGIVDLVLECWIDDVLSESYSHPMALRVDGSRILVSSFDTLFWIQAGSAVELRVRCNYWSGTAGGSFTIEGGLSVIYGVDASPPGG